jgi:preprotein translocase subunit SecE
MSSKSKRKHANKEYNRANNKLPAKNTEDSAEIPAPQIDETPAAAVGELVLTPKQLRQREKEQRKQAKEQIKAAKLKEKEKNKKKDKKDGEEKRGTFAWVGEIGSELKKVHWPTFQQTMKATGVVLGIVVVFSLIILGMDRLLGWLYNILIS